MPNSTPKLVHHKNAHDVPFLPSLYLKTYVWDFENSQSVNFIDFFFFFFFWFIVLFFCYHGCMLYPINHRDDAHSPQSQTTTGNPTVPSDGYGLDLDNRWLVSTADHGTKDIPSSGQMEKSFLGVTMPAWGRPVQRKHWTPGDRTNLMKPHI